MPRRMLGVLALVLALVGPLGAAHAAPEVTLQTASDGSLVVVGSGWRPGQHLVVALGAADLQASANSVGEFELPTGLNSYHGSIAVRRRDSVHAGTDMLDQPSGLNPLTVLFAQTLVSGAITVCGAFAALALVRPLRSRDRS
jgi:hypothetical protein